MVRAINLVTKIHISFYFEDSTIFDNNIYEYIFRSIRTNVITFMRILRNCDRMRMHSMK